MFIDSHCHIYYDIFNNDIADVINRAHDAGVEKLICVGVDLKSSDSCIQLADTFENRVNLIFFHASFIFIKFKKIAVNSKFNFEEISELYFFPSGRWDIKNNKGILIKLPETNLSKALNLAYHITINETFKNDKVIDLRIDGKIVVE